MSVWTLIFREIGHRKGHFLLSLVAVSAAVASLVGAVTLLDAHRHRTAQLLSAKQAAVEEQAAQTNDEIRNITKKLGFNILILPKDQNLHEVYDKGFGEKTMPEEYVRRLTSSNIAVINHVLPSLIRKVEWPEQRRTIVLVGTRGEEKLRDLNAKTPILDAVPQGKAVLGYELHRQLQLEPGRSIRLMGRTFEVQKCVQRRGNQDDITVWISLAEAQELLSLKGQINAIYALECNCETVDRIGQIRDEVAQLLPETQVTEFETQAVARAEARNLARKEGALAVAAEKAHGDKLQRERESLAAWLVPLVLAVSALWIALLTYSNVKARVSEIGVLRALGVGNGRILWLFLGKALLVGVLGAVVGYPLGFGLGLVWSGGTQETAGLFSGTLLALSLSLAPILALCASWLPAQIAARLDPAVVLGGE
jgi:putative ABC transport system permease protein